MTIEYSGGGDPDRILAMLWRRTRPADPEAKTPRGRKPRLTLDSVVAAAIALADAEGLPAMSMGRVAGSLGVGTMTLYSYVPSKAELLDLMVDEVLGERTLPAPGEPRPDGWRAQVELYAERTRAMYDRHPWLRHVSTVRPPIGPGMLAEREYLLSTLAGTGLTFAQQDAAAMAVATFVNATASLEVESAQIERATGQSHDAWWQEREALWEEYFDVERYPTMTHIWTSGGFDKGTSDATAAGHEFGFQRLLDGIQVIIDQA
ncbi:TetR/AcrR family transcriptional regulator C-terminal domain-containing protein [Actinopolymorpha alba]|uniref:TetR/AcrR family transcriptional regulator C-terminal domain-containing protein n=1 Tax=Actinopolymorpha alba TaxID=533267 RepID=UPI00037DF12D|nr:TetR/AcrR family transcriptional regulator C-terminal domain-containing protein [Actinopolymorpha alba]